MKLIKSIKLFMERRQALAECKNASKVCSVLNEKNKAARERCELSIEKFNVLMKTDLEAAGIQQTVMQNDIEDLDKLSDQFSIAADKHIEAAEKYSYVSAKKLWAIFEQTLVDDNDCIESDFLHFDAGTDRFDILRWFEEEFNVSVYKDLMGSE